MSEAINPGSLVLEPTHFDALPYQLLGGQNTQDIKYPLSLWQREGSNRWLLGKSNVEMFIQGKNSVHALRLVYSLFLSALGVGGSGRTQGVFTPNVSRRVSVCTYFLPLLGQCGLEINYMVVPCIWLGNV